MPRDEAAMTIISTKFEVDTTIHCKVSVVAARLRDLDLGQWSYVAGHVVNRSTKFEDPTPIRPQLMSCDVCHRPPLSGTDMFAATEHAPYRDQSVYRKLSPHI